MDPLYEIPPLGNFEPQSYSIFEETRKCAHENHSEYIKTCDGSSRNDIPCHSNSKVKILLRGDILCAINCMFPNLQLIPADATNKFPILDPNFSLFSAFIGGLSTRQESNEELKDIFVSAKKYRAVIFQDFTSKKAILKQNLEEFIQKEFLATQSDNSSKIAADAVAKVNTTERNGTQICTNIESKTPIRNRSGQHYPFEESYLSFVDNVLDDCKVADFKQIESIILELDQESKILKVESIAPFNSNLPVLNISQLKPSSVPLVSPLIAPKLKKTKSSLLKSQGKMLMKNTETPSSSKLPVKKPSTKKRKRACAKQSSTNTSKTNINEEKPIDNFEKDIKSLTAMMQCNFEAMSSNSTVHIKTQQDQSIELDSNFTHVSFNNGDILKNNIQDLKLKNIDNYLAQKQKIQFDLSTLFLRQKPDLSICDSCETLLPEMRHDSYRKDLRSISSSESLSELEKEAIQQYRNSEESIEEKFAALEREAQEQYFS